MIFYYIDKQERGMDVQNNSLNINFGLNRRSNSAEFMLFRGAKPSGGEPVKIYLGTFVESISGNDLVLKKNYQENAEVFRVGQRIVLGIGQHYEYRDNVVAYDEQAGVLTMEKPIVNVQVGDKVGENIFGGMIVKVDEDNLHSLHNLEYRVMCAGFEKMFDRKLISDTWVDVGVRYIVNDFLNTTVNLNRDIDNMSYKPNEKTFYKILAGGDNSRLYIGNDLDITWNEIQPAGNVDRAWELISISADGQTIIVGVHSPTNGRLYMSTNGGTTWNEVQPAGDVNRLWYRSSMSADGQTIIVGVYSPTNGRLYMSTNAGTTWNEVQPAGNVNRLWATTSMSEDGQTIIAGIGDSTNGRLYMSTNAGATWSEVQPAGNVNRLWATTSMSADGQTIIVGVYSPTNGRLYMSTNGGTTWNEVQPAGDVDRAWYWSSMSADGQIILLNSITDGMFLSKDGGGTWNEVQPAGDVNRLWYRSSMSADGQIILLNSITDGMFLSKDGGGTWDVIATPANPIFWAFPALIPEETITVFDTDWIESGNALKAQINSDMIEGISSTELPFNSGTAHWNLSFPTKNLYSLVGISSGVPTQCRMMLWIKTSDVIDDLILRVESSGGSYSISLKSEIDATNTGWQYLSKSLTLGTETNSIDWEAIEGARITIQSSAGGTVLVNGFRINGDGAFTPKHMEESITLKEYRAPNVRPSDIVDTLAKASQYTWYIDFEQNVHFHQKAVQPCYHKINNNSNNFYQLATAVDSTQLGNRVIIEGGDRASDNFYSQAVRGDGTIREWLLKTKFKGLTVKLDDGGTTHTMEAGTTTTNVKYTDHRLATGDWIVNRTRHEAREIIVVDDDNFTILPIDNQTNGDVYTIFNQEMKVGVEGLHEDSANDYMSNYNEKSIRASQQTDTLTEDDYLLFTYLEVKKLAIQYTDGLSASRYRQAGLGDGIFDIDKVVDVNITDASTAIALATAKTQEFANPIIEGGFFSTKNGFKIGDLLQVDEIYRVMSGEYLINNISIRQQEGKYKDSLEYSVNFGTTLFGAIEFFQKLMGQNKGTEINIESAVETFVSIVEILELNDTNTTTLYGGDWKFEPSIGQPLPSRYDLAHYS